MKKIYTSIFALFIVLTTFAQTPEQMSYQAVIRNSANELVTNTQVGMQISILQGTASGSAVYVETQTPTTNVNGLVSLEIGTGTVVSGDFSTIDWANGPYFIKTETDLTGGTTYSITETSQLMSVPYALYAKESGSSNPPNLETVLTENNSANNHQIKDLADPTDDQDAVTKVYTYSKEDVDAIVAELKSQIPTVSGVTTITDVTAGDSQVEIKFDAPSDDGGSAIIEYTATSSPGDITGSVSQAEGGTITVDGLTNGTAYTFTVTATNGIGTSAASAASTSVTPLVLVTYTILDEYTNSVPTGTSYKALTEYNEYVDAGSVDASPFVITKQTSHEGGILFYGTTELISEDSENTFRLTSSTGNFDFISFDLTNLEPNIYRYSGTSSTLPRITLTSSSGSTVTYEATATAFDAGYGIEYMYEYRDTGVKTLNWNNLEWVDIETQYVKAKTKTYVLKTL